MADVFGRQDQLLNGGLSADSMFMTWPELGNNGLGMLVQQVGLSYSQSVRRIFELGPGLLTGVFGGLKFVQPTYYIIGRPEGTMQMSRFIGPQAIASCFYRKYGSPCAPNNMLLSGKSGCSPTDSGAVTVTWQLNGVTLNQLNINVTAQEMVMQENVGAMFTGMYLYLNGQEAGQNCVLGDAALVG